MTNTLIAFAHARPRSAAAAAIAISGALTIAAVYYFEYVLGYQPCPLCLEQRKAFYVCVPLAALLWLGNEHGASRKVMAAGFAVIALGMLWNTGLSAYHAGVEWKLWAGPTECSGTVNSFGNAGGLLKSLQEIHIPRCDEAAWTFLGVSLAGYDVPVSLALALIAMWGVKASLAQSE
jgi:disulfide bond formation protein DsbB